jgi:hypothetical protein
MAKGTKIFQISRQFVSHNAALWGEYKRAFEAIPACIQLNGELCNPDIVTLEKVNDIKDDDEQPLGSRRRRMAAQEYGRECLRATQSISRTTFLVETLLQQDTTLSDHLRECKFQFRVTVPCLPGEDYVSPFYFIQCGRFYTIYQAPGDFYFHLHYTGVWGGYVNHYLEVPLTNDEFHAQVERIASQLSSPQLQNPHWGYMRVMVASSDYLAEEGGLVTTVDDYVIRVHYGRSQWGTPLL